MTLPNMKVRLAHDAREATRQRLATNIMNGLYKIIPFDENRPKAYADVARALLLRATGRIIGKADTLCKELVLDPIDAFTENPEERTLLVARVASRIVDGVILFHLQRKCDGNDP